MTRTAAGSGASSSTRATRAPGWWLGAAVCTVVGVAALLVLAAQGRTWASLASGHEGFSALMAAAYSVVGAAIHERRPDNRLAGVLFATGASRAAAVGVLPWTDGTGPVSAIADWLGFALPFVALGLAPLSLLWFPDGRLPDDRRRWRYAERSTLVALLALFGVMAASYRFRGPHLYEVGPPTDNAQGVLTGVLLALLLGAAGSGVLAGLASLVGRWRAHGRGTVRQQLKWYLLGAVAAVVLNVAGDVAGIGVLNLVGTAALVAAIFVGVARHDLWDVDRVLRRTVVYGTLSAVLLALYVGGVLALGVLLDGVGHGQSLAVAAATLAVATLAGPLRARLQSRVDRRFDRRRFDAVSLMRAHVRATGVGGPRPGQTEALLRTVLRDPELQVSYRCGDGRLVDAWGRVAGVPHGEPSPFVFAGWVLVHGDVEDYDKPLWEAVLRAAGPALAQCRLHAEVLAQVAEVAESRRRVVSAGDVERRRIERNLHDGAQQRLVSLAMRLRSEQRQHPESWGQEGQQVLDETVAEIRRSVDDLRALAAGLLPGSLVTEGLQPALLELAARHPQGVEVVVDLDHRHEPEVDEVAWFVASEGVTNALKYAGVDNVKVEVVCVDRTLVLDVQDLGCGGAVPAHGLTGLRDRVEAAGGTLLLESPVGAGTSLTLRLPCAS